MARFYYTRTKREVEIPDHLAAEYERRRWYQRLPDDDPHTITAPMGIAEPMPDIDAMTVAAVVDWVKARPGSKALIAKAERAGKNRATLLKALR